ncbi:protein LAZY 1-like [Lactuca sativa]|uniref:protein LAZY 1-like n=1 Tax=Lactuca sativa TaxID=4236 RepID=UPI000CD888EF|nr:protein LAZY 1-like [Lactuca sativa]
MNALGWMHRKFKKNNDEEKRNVSTRKSSSCFSTLLGLHEQQYYPEEKKFSAHFRQPRVYSESSLALEAHSVKELDEEETGDMNMQFIHAFLAIGTLGSISVTEESMTPKVAMQIETEASENEVKSLNKLEKLNEKEVINSVINESRNEKGVTLDEKEINGMDTKDNKSMAICPFKEFSETPPTKEGERKQKPKPTNLFKKSEAHAMHFMKKMLKKLDITSQRSPTSANICDPTEKKPTRVFRKSRKIHPEAANRYVSKSHNSEMKRTSYDEDNDKQLKVKDEGTKHPRDGMLKKETVSCYPNGEKAHWIKTDAEYFVLEF